MQSPSRVSAVPDNTIRTELQPRELVIPAGLKEEITKRALAELFMRTSGGVRSKALAVSGWPLFPFSSFPGLLAEIRA
jgi:hypothetical protein